MHLKSMFTTKQVYDIGIENISSRFKKHELLYANFFCLNPNNFQPNLPLTKNY